MHARSAIFLRGFSSGKVSVRDLAGPVGIVQMSGQAAKRGPHDALELDGCTSASNLGLLNLLPIPILDGGHVLMLAIEGMLRRDLSIAVKERFVQVGLVFLLGIFAFVMYSDILRVIQTPLGASPSASRDFSGFSGLRNGFLLYCSI